MISNDGPVHNRASKSSRSGVGLTNTKDRLRLQYKDAFTFQYTERPQGGVQIEISIPYKQHREEKADKAASTLRPEHVGAADIDLAPGKIPADQHVLH